MKLIDALEIIARILMEVLIAERTYGPGTGSSKRQYVISKIEPSLREPRSPSIMDLGDINDILETITELVNVLVKLLSLLGVFRRAAKREAEQDPADNG